ncbi:hypothetical protein B0H11DRAFT_1901640 [Mycena galericulata]|nr:hypothetical protein B0H11DRAFT_1901640 [Mycena galericulata]
MPRSSPPPPYSDVDIVSALDHLNLSNDSESTQAPVCSPPRSTPSRQTPARTPSGLAHAELPLTPEHRTRIYRYQSPTSSGYTPDWEFAAAQTQGVPGGKTLRIPKKTGSRHSKGGYAVFVGKKIGAFSRWDDVEPLVLGIPNALHQGYTTFDDALAAFAYARERSWTRVCAARPSSPGAVMPAQAVATVCLPTPTSYTDALNPLHGHNPDTGRKRLWYIVYRGITPGVYQSSLECQLNTVGIPGAVHDSCDDKMDAINRFERASRAGRYTQLSGYFSEMPLLARINQGETFDAYQICIVVLRYYKALRPFRPSLWRQKVPDTLCQYTER